MRRWFLGLSGGSFLSKLLGALRELLLARAYGTGVAADAFGGSLALAFSPAHLLTQRLVQNSFIPLYSRYHRSDPLRARALFVTLLGAHLGLGLLIGLLLFTAAEPLVGLFLPGFDPERRALAAAMLRSLAPGIPCYVYTGFLGALAVAQEDFLIPALRPGLQNLGLIASILLAVASRRPELAAAGFSAAYLVMALVATLLVWRRNEIPPRGAYDGALLRDALAALWTLLRPLLAIALLAEGFILTERALASATGPGVLAALGYARFLTELSHTLVVVPLGLIGLSHFSRLEEPALRAATDRILARLLLFLVPLAAFLALSGEPLLRLLFARGSFGEESMELTWAALRGLSLGLWAMGANFFLQRVYYARLANGIVLRGEAIFTAVALTAMPLLSARFGVFGLALGSSLGFWAALAYYLRRLPGPLREPRRVLAWLALLLPIYLVPAWWLSSRVRNLPGLLIMVLFWVLYWLAAYGIIPTLRRLTPTLKAPGDADA